MSFSRPEVNGILDIRGLMAGFLQGPGAAVNLRIVAFSDEEGLRFGTTFLGSKALAGAPPQGVMFRDALSVSKATVVLDLAYLNSRIHVKKFLSITSFRTCARQPDALWTDNQNSFFY
jgi:hypothetical protein